MTTTTADALLAAVLANPADDAPRLIWADMLEERDGHGDAERAEFVRVQVRLAEIERGITKAGDLGHLAKAIVWNEKQQLRRRERELLERNKLAFLGPAFTGGWSVLPYESHLNTATFRRGFVEEVACPLETWTGGVCEGCHNSNSHGFAGHGNWRRFECPHCRGTGRVAGVGAALVACQPVTTVRGTGQEPYRSPGGGWSWYRGETPSGEHPPSDLPGSVFDALGGGNRQRHFRWYDDEAAAMADLSAALLQMANGGDA